MRNFSKKLRIRRHRKKFSLNHYHDKPTEQLSQVVLRDARFNQGTSWIEEDMKFDANSRETTPTREDASFSLSSDESDCSTTREAHNTAKANVSSHYSLTDTKAVEIQSDDQQEKWTKDVIFEAEQLILKAEIEKLRNQADKKKFTEQEVNKASKGSMNGVLERREKKLEKRPSLRAIAEYDIAAVRSNGTTNKATKQPRSAFSKFSRKFGKFSLNKSMESLSNEPTIELRECKSEKDVRVSQERLLVRKHKGSNSTNGFVKSSSMLTLAVEHDSSTASTREANETTEIKQQKPASRVSRNLGRVTSKSMGSLSIDEYDDEFMLRESKSEQDVHSIQEESMTTQEVDEKVDEKDNSSNGSQDEMNGRKLEKWSSLPVITEHDNATPNSNDTNNFKTVKQQRSKASRKLGKFTSKSMGSLLCEPEIQSKLRQSKSERDLITLMQEGSMALLRAARNNSVLQAGALLNHGISPEILDQRGWTPLCIALEHENLKCAEVLVRWRANVNFIHEDGTSILHRITSLGSYNGIKFLLRHGVDVTVEDSKGWPAVHYGLQGNNLKCTALLLAGGVNSEVYTRKRIDEYKAVVRMATVGKWTYKWQNVLEIDLDTQVDL